MLLYKKIEVVDNLSTIFKFTKGLSSLIKQIEKDYKIILTDSIEWWYISQIKTSYKHWIKSGKKD